MRFDIQDMAYCGLWCPQCSFKTAAETGDRAHVDCAPERYEHLKGKELSEYACEGCKGDNICGQCGIKECAVEKGVQICADCAQFPCEKITAFGEDGTPHHAGALRALETIRRIGREAWFEGIRADLSCARCNRRLSWYYTCPEHPGKQV